MKLVKDKDQNLDVEEALEGFGLEKLDRHKILNKLLKPDLRRYITNVKDNGTLNTLVYMDAHRKAIEMFIEPEVKAGQREQATAEQKQIAAAFQQVPDFLLTIQDSYADWRISIKGFRSKQIVDAIASEYAHLKHRQEVFNKAFTPQENIK